MKACKVLSQINNKIGDCMEAGQYMTAEGATEKELRKVKHTLNKLHKKYDRVYNRNLKKT